jgi:hypothetical protein
MRQEQGGCSPRCETKKQLKEAVRDIPHKVYLKSTSNFGGWSGRADELPKDMEFLVVGPDPYRRRNWYATVKQGRGGKLVVT